MMWMVLEAHSVRLQCVNTLTLILCLWSGAVVTKGSVSGDSRVLDFVGRITFSSE